MIGSEAVESYDRRGFEVHGADNNMRREFFGPKGKIFYVHMRDVNGHVPRFEECFLGEGNYDPAAVIRQRLGSSERSITERTSPGKFTLGENYIYIVMPITIDT